MGVIYETGLKRCICGGKPKYRYHSPFHWVECQNKRCKRRTRYYKDVDEEFDRKAKGRAFAEWNSYD